MLSQVKFWSRTPHFAQEGVIGITPLFCLFLDHTLVSPFLIPF